MKTKLLLVFAILSSFNQAMAAPVEEYKPVEIYYASYAADNGTANQELSFMILNHHRPYTLKEQIEVYGKPLKPPFRTRKRRAYQFDACQANIPNTFFVKAEDDYYQEYSCKVPPGLLDAYRKAE